MRLREWLPWADPEIEEGKGGCSMWLAVRVANCIVGGSGSMLPPKKFKI